MPSATHDRSRARPRCRVLAGSVIAALSLASPSASADDLSSAARRAHAARQRGLPYTTVELASGLLALPGATVCPRSLDTCETGEISLGVSIRNLYQFGSFALGAGVSWATTLRNDEARGADDLLREHSRRYFLVEGLFRYALVQEDDFELWAGGGIGLVTIRDAWTVATDRNPPSDVQFVGPEALDIRTEGLAVSAGVGGSWFVADNFSIGGRLRYGNWVMPFSPDNSPLGDVASLSGRVDVVDLQFSAAYRLAL